MKAGIQGWGFGGFHILGFMAVHLQAPANHLLAGGRVTCTTTCKSPAGDLQTTSKTPADDLKHLHQGKFFRSVFGFHILRFMYCGPSSVGILLFRVRFLGWLREIMFGNLVQFRATAWGVSSHGVLSWGDGLGRKLTGMDSCLRRNDGGGWVVNPFPLDGGRLGWG